MNNSHNPKVSVIVGIYKGQKYIRECIDSILSQTYENLEIILIDDGSPDDCGKIIDEYMQKDIRVRAIHQENSGVSIARNVGIQYSTGDYICIVDQDDCISPDYVSYFYKLIEDNSTDIALTLEVDKFWGKIKEDGKRDYTEIWTGEQTAVEMLYHKIVIAPWNKMIKKSLIVDNGIVFNSRFFCGEGFAFSVECYQRAKSIAVGHKKVYHYRIGDPESGASMFRESTIYSSIEAQMYIKNTFIRETPELLKAWKFSYWHTHCDCLNIMVGCGVIKQYYELYKKLKTVCWREAKCALNAPVSMQQRLRGLLFLISPYMAAKIINRFRIRKFL